MQDSSSQPPVPPPTTYYPKRKRSRWWIPVAIIGGLLLCFFIGFAVFISIITEGLDNEKPVSVRDNSVLVLDLSKGLPELTTPAPFDFGGQNKTASLRDALQALERAKSDDRIKGLYLKGSVSDVGMAKLTELRDALMDFKQSKKFIYAYIEASNKQQYYLASVADSIFMPTEGMLEFSAFGASAPFLKGMFEKIGVEWHVQQFEEYKSAAESYTRTGWSEPAREELRALIQQRHDMFVSAVARARSIDEATVRMHLDSGVYTASDAKEARLIDGFAFEHDVREKMKHAAGVKDSSQSLRTVSINGYLSDDLAVDDAGTIDSDKGIAIVYASGAIMPGSDGDPFGGDGIYSRTLVRNLRKAADDKSVQGIILRIDSPGGSVIASEEVWAAIRDIRTRTGKPIYASMSDVAASGGYYIAMACDTIVAHPATITGSIGVILSIPNLAGTMGKLGVTIDTISMGRSAQFMNPLQKFTEADKARLMRMSQPIYQRFVSKVAESRKKTYDDTRAVAKGRVWTGDAAKGVGLVDVHGGLQASIDLMKQRLGVPKGTKVPVAVYPKQKEPIEAILRMIGLDNNDEDDARIESEVLVQALVSQVAGPQTPWQHVYEQMPVELQRQVRYVGAVGAMSKSEHVLATMPALIDIR